MRGRRAALSPAYSELSAETEGMKNDQKLLEARTHAEVHRLLRVVIGRAFKREL
jgi:hypothetical protein